MSITIAALADEHVSPIVAACRDWQELAVFGPPYWRPRSPAELHRKIAATSGPQPATEYSFVLEESDGRLVGECSLHGIDYRNSLAQVGVCIWNPADRGSGYGRVAVAHIIMWGTSYLGLERLEAWIVEGNQPSLKLFSHFGFKHEATVRGRYLHAGQRRSMHVLAFDTEDE